MFGSTVGVSAPSSACLFVMFHSSIWNLHTKMKKSTKSEPPVRLRQGSHLRWSNTTKQVKLKKGKLLSNCVLAKTIFRVQILSGSWWMGLLPGGTPAWSWAGCLARQRWWKRPPCRVWRWGRRGWRSQSWSRRPPASCGTIGCVSTLHWSLLSSWCHFYGQGLL